MRRARAIVPVVWRRALAIVLAPLCALALGACGDTLQDQPIGPALLEGVIVKSRFPVYWLGLKFQGMRITGVTIDRGYDSLRRLLGGRAVHVRDAAVGGELTRQQLHAGRRGGEPPATGEGRDGELDARRRDARDSDRERCGERARAASLAGSREPGPSSPDAVS